MTLLTTFPPLNDLHHLARALSIMPLFSIEMQRAASSLRIPGAWPRHPGHIKPGGQLYFRGEAAALGPMKASAVAAHLYLFPRDLVEAALAERSDHDTDIIASRLDAGAQLMNRVLGNAEADAAATLSCLRELVDGLDAAARPGFAALADLEWPRATWASICFATRLLHEYQRESRFHAAAAQLSGAEYVALMTGANGRRPTEALAEAGWDDDAIDATYDQLLNRGLLIDDHGGEVGDQCLSDDAKALVCEVEFVADRAQRALSIRIDDRTDDHLNRLERWGNLLVNDLQMRDAVQTTSYALLSCL